MADQTNEEQYDTGPGGNSTIPKENPELKIIESMFEGGKAVTGDLTVTVTNTGDPKTNPKVEVNELTEFVPKTSEGGGTRGGKKRRKKRRSTKKKRKQKQKKRAK